MLRPVSIICVLMVVALGGCKSAKSLTKSDLTFGASNYDKIYQASLDVLQAHGFKLDITDYRFGKITTQRAISPTVAEVWKSQNSDLGLSLNSTANLLSRKVIVSLAPDKNQSSAINKKIVSAKQDKNYRLKVTVNLSDKQLPKRRVIGAASGFVFNTLYSVPPQMKKRGITSDYWIKTAEDKKLESILTKQILAKTRSEN